MTSTAAITQTTLSVQIETLRKEAEEAKKKLNYELYFMLIDEAESLENQLLSQQEK
jgi:hypothetical protein